MPTNGNSLPKCWLTKVMLGRKASFIFKNINFKKSRLI